MYCKNCGNKIKDGGKFCSHCGTAKNEENGRTSLNAQGNVRGKKKHKRPVIIAIIIFVVVCAATGVFFVVSGNTDSTEFIGTTKGTGLTEKEAEQILLGDISDDDWEIFDSSNEALAEVAGQYAADEGYIAKDNKEAVINAVAGKVDEFYEERIVSWYMCDEDGVYFEYASGLTAFYQPEAEGYASGGDEISILSFSPFENEDNWNTSYTAGTFINDSLDTENFSWAANEDVTIGLLKEQSSSVFFLWNGHGNYVHIWGYKFPVLQTGQAGTDRTDIDTLSAKEVTTKIAAILWFDDKLAYETTDKWCITPFFVENRLSMEKGMAYLLACQSGRDDKLAAAFTNIGAEVSFVHVGTENVRKWYANNMMRSIIAYMAGGIDGIYHTADEALELSNSYWTHWFIDNGGHTAEIDEQDVHFDTLTEYIEGAQGGTHVEVRGAGLYTLCSCIRGTVSFEDGVTDDEISELLDTLSVSLYTEGENFVKSITLSETKFYFNDLDPGTYWLQLYSNNEAVGQIMEVTVKEHRYSSVDLLYSLNVPLEGYVYDKDTEEPLSGVTVTADMKNTSVLYSAETVTDENGYYCIEVTGVEEYILSYELDEYDSVRNEIEITVEMYNNAQTGLSSILDDVYMENIGTDAELLFNGHRYKLLYSEKITWTDAKEYCEDLGGHLLTINSEEEQEAVYQYIEGFEIDADIWIGITDVDSEGDWSHWITGEEVTYTNWGDGEPDNYQSRIQDQNYGVICSGYRRGSTYYIEPGEWDDIDEYGSTVSGYFVCEWD